MKCILSVLLCLCMMSCKSNSAVKSPPAEPGVAPVAKAQPFPPKFDYPLSAETLDHAVAMRDDARLRRHGWYLFAGLNTPAADGLPIWRSWPTSTPAYALPSMGMMDLEKGPASGRSLIRLNRDNTPVMLPTPQYPVPEAICKTPACRLPGPERFPLHPPGWHHLPEQRRHHDRGRHLQ
ncbi:hypothetical protein ACN28S_42275 [Cystobacter fuscus]